MVDGTSCMTWKTSSRSIRFLMLMRNGEAMGLPWLLVAHMSTDRPERQL